MKTEDIKKIMDGEVGKSLKEFFIQELNSLKFINNIEETRTPSHQVIEFKAQKKAFNKLVDIFDKIMTISEVNLKKGQKDRYDA